MVLMGGCNLKSSEPLEGTSAPSSAAGYATLLGRRAALASGGKKDAIKQHVQVASAPPAVQLVELLPGASLSRRCAGRKPTAWPRGADRVVVKFANEPPEFFEPPASYYDADLPQAFQRCAGRKPTAWPRDPDLATVVTIAAVEAEYRDPPASYCQAEGLPPLFKRCTERKPTVWPRGLARRMVQFQDVPEFLEPACGEEASYPSSWRSSSSCQRTPWPRGADRTWVSFFEGAPECVEPPSSYYEGPPLNFKRCSERKPTSWPRGLDRVLVKFAAGAPECIEPPVSYYELEDWPRVFKRSADRKPTAFPRGLLKDAAAALLEAAEEEAEEGERDLLEARLSDAIQFLEPSTPEIDASPEGPLSAGWPAELDEGSSTDAAISRAPVPLWSVGFLCCEVPPRAHRALPARRTA